MLVPNWTWALPEMYSSERCNVLFLHTCPSPLCLSPARVPFSSDLSSLPPPSLSSSSPCSSVGASAAGSGSTAGRDASSSLKCSAAASSSSSPPWNKQRQITTNSQIRKHKPKLITSNWIPLKVHLKETQRNVDSQKQMLTLFYSVCYILYLLTIISGWVIKL